MQGPQALAALFQQGLSLHQQSQFEQARVAYEHMLTLHPGHADAMHMLGVMAMQSTNYALAVERISVSVQANPANATAQLNLGLAYKELQRFDEALSCYQQAIHLRPGYAEAFNNRGVALHACQRLDEALVSLSQAITLKADYAQAFFNRALVLQATGRLDAALADFEKAIEIQPDYAQAWNNRGVVLQEQLRWDEAATSYVRAIAAQPDLGQAHYNLGNALRALGRFEEAIASYDAAIGLEADAAHAFNNRGLALQELQRSAQAIASYDAAIAIQANYADAYWNKAIELLLCGDFAQGWKLYEWRWKRDAFTSRKRDFAQPLWLGDAPLVGKTVLLHAEQGLGDSIQFCRYARDVQALGAHVLLEVPRPLMSLFASLEGVSQIIEKGAPLPQFDYHCPLLSLPLAFQTRLEQLPGHTPYLASTVPQRNRWQRRLGPRTKPRVGLVWSGNALDKNDLQRSMRLQDLLPYLSSDFEFICLQKEMRPVDQHLIQTSQIRFFGAQIEDFSDTAALCDLVDLVISVDTSVAHLAGALGKPTWILLPYTPDWRWMLHRDDSPWYPSVRLYRQTQERAWPSVLERMRSDLSGLARSGN